MKRIIITGICFGFSFCQAWAQADTPKTARQLAVEIIASTDAAKKNELLSKLGNLKPHSTADVEDLVAVSRDADDSEVKESAGLALQRVGPADKAILAQAYIKALDEKDWRTRISLIVGVGRLKAVEALPKLRSIVKEKPRKDELKMLDANYEEQRKSVWATYSSPAMAARTLGELKDEESIPLLASKYDDLGEAATESLAMIGKKAIPALLKLAKKEAGASNNPATMAFAQMSDKTAKSDLIVILKNEKDDSIRLNVVQSLFSYMYDDEVAAEVKNLYKKDNNWIFLSAMKTKSAVPFLIDVLKSDKGAENRWYVAALLGDIGDKSAVPALEEALLDSRKDVRVYSAYALKKLTGKDYDWRK